MQFLLQGNIIAIFSLSPSEVRAEKIVLTYNSPIKAHPNT